MMVIGTLKSAMNNSLLRIPLFPINISILPDELMPLHIFEDRYKKMVSDSLNNNKEFGIIYKRDKEIKNIGCSVFIKKVYQKYDDGRLRELRLSSNSIYIVPNSISTLDSLETIWLNNNNITALDPSICNLSILSDFYISDNQLCDQYKFDCINWGANDDHWEPQECNE